MRFQVPQFIDIEDKIFGPFTFKQFVYLAGGVGLAYVIYTFLPFLIALPLMLASAGLGAMLAFYKVNDKPFILFLESWVRFQLTDKLYIWKKEDKKPTTREKKPSSGDGATVAVPRLSQSKLRDLSWSLDVKNPDTES